MENARKLNHKISIHNGGNIIFALWWITFYTPGMSRVDNYQAISITHIPLYFIHFWLVEHEVTIWCTMHVQYNTVALNAIEISRTPFFNPTVGHQRSLTLL